MKKLHYISALSLIFVSIISYVPLRATALSFSDVENHWAEKAITRWSGEGVLNGYPDGTFRPNDNVKRGELATIINNLMHFPEAPDDYGLFTDVENKWYAGDINALGQQGVYLVQGGEAKGDAVLTREEAVVMIFNAFPIANPANDLSFTDFYSISKDYQSKIRAMRNTGFVSGFPDGSFRPGDPITRAEVLTIIDNMITDYITEPGDYSSFEGDRVFIAVPEVRLQFADSLHYLVISPNAAMGETIINGSSSTYCSRYTTEWILENKNLDFKGRVFRSNKAYLRFYDPRFAGGYGNEYSPYLISNADHLILLNDYYDSRHRNTYFEMENDIALTGEWAPLGENVSSFPGVFDGKGHTISELSITTAGPPNVNRRNIGLFCSISGIVRNLTVSGNISIDTEINNISIGGIGGYVSNYDYYKRPTIENCISNVNITVSGNLIRAGGIAGETHSSAGIVNCKSTGTITASSDNHECDIYAGGIAGDSERAYFSDCTSGSKITVSAYKTAFAGGIVGYIYEGSSIEGCKTDSTVMATSKEAAYAGGIAGYCNDIELTKCQVSGAISAESGNQDEKYSSCAGGVVARIHSSKVSDSFSNAEVNATGGNHVNAGGFAGFVDGSEDGKTQSSIIGCYATGQVHVKDGGFQNNAGGFCGQVLNSTIDSCWANTEVTIGRNEGSINVAGGFASGVYLGGVVKNCYALGSVTEYGIWFLTMDGSFTGRLEGSVINCYATGETAVVDNRGTRHAYNTIIGSRRGEGGVITQCVDLTNDAARGFLIIDEPVGKSPVETVVSQSQVTQAGMYSDAGWDFTDVWTMPADSDSYGLPVLRGVYEDIQRGADMPPHLK